MASIQFIANQKINCGCLDKGAAAQGFANSRDTTSTFNGDELGSKAADVFVGGLLFADARATREFVETMSALEARCDVRGAIAWNRVQARTIEFYRALVEAFLESGARLSCAIASSAAFPDKGQCLTWYGMYKAALMPHLRRGMSCELFVDQRFGEYPCGGGADCKMAYIADSTCLAGKRGPRLQKDAVLRTRDLEHVIEHGLLPESSVVVDTADDEMQNHLMGLVDVFLGIVAYGAACRIGGVAGSVAKSELVQMVDASLSVCEKDGKTVNIVDYLGDEAGVQFDFQCEDDVDYCDPDAPPPGSII